MLTLLPAAILALVATSALWGDSGVFERYELRGRLAAANADLASLERENRRLIREIAVLDQERVALERQVAEEIGRVSPGTTLYRFDSAVAVGSVRGGDRRR